MATRDFEVRMLFRSCADARTRVRSVIESLLATERVSAFTREDVEEILLAIQECLSNIARHAYAGAELPVELAIQVGAGGFKAAISDRGRSPRPEHLISRDPSEPREGGRGLYLLRQTMDRIEYGKEGTRNVTRLRRGPRMVRG